MTILGQSAFLKALGWALLNSVWQFGVLWLVFMVLIRNRQNLSPAVKHGAALGLLVAGFTWFGVDISIRYLLYKDAVSAAAEGFGLDTPAFYQGFYVSIKQLVESNLAYLSLVYLAIVSALFTKFSRYFY